MLWIALHLPSLSLESFAATLGLAEAGRPVALIEAHRIAQADAAAHALGIRPGMKRATALALAPQLVLGQSDAHRDRQALTAVAHAALAFTPAVTVAPPVVLLEVQASLRCFGGRARLLERLGASLQPLGHRVHLAIAPTASGAGLLARGAMGGVGTDEPQAHRNTLGPRPAAFAPGVALRAHADTLQALRTQLDPLPLELLGPGREHWEALQGMGLRTLGDLRALPRAGLARRFGPELLLELDRARGDVPESQVWVELPSSFSQRIELFARADTTDQVLAGARLLLARLVAWAQGRHGRIARFTLAMHHEPRHRHDATTPAATELEIAPAEPALDLPHLQLLLAERLARLPMVAPALELSLRCDALVMGEPPNGELFPTRAGEQAGLARLIERLQARLGREQVRGLESVADHRPERATRCDALDPARWARIAAQGRQVVAATHGGEARSGTPGRMAQAAAWGEHLAPLTRPVWLWPEPLPLADLGGRPCLDGRPLQLLAGPERIESGWWDGALATRDYFIAAAADGTLAWIYRARLPLAADPQADGSALPTDPQEEGVPTPDRAAGWYLHGRFA